MQNQFTTLGHGMSVKSVTTKINRLLQKRIIFSLPSCKFSSFHHVVLTYLCKAGVQNAARVTKQGFSLPTYHL